MLDAVVSLADETLEATIMDVSAGGTKVRFKTDKMGDVHPTMHVAIDIPPFGGFEGEIIWMDDKYAGIKFDDDHKVTVSLIHDMVEISR